jgi:outer membrane protein OmpA-like peptidoglycan-associated protein
MRKRLASLLFLAATAAATTGCAAHYQSAVKVNDVALGRVVVYRNGVAYYERRAMVKGGKLTVVVPRDRVDDLLKSLTVADAKTGEPLPVSFPRDQGDYGSVVEMTLEVPAKDTEVVLTYVTEAPAWKPSYRLVVDEKKHKVMLQAWAIIDNTSGEDWKDVILGVGSSSAMSFHYDLWSVRTVQRETLQSQDTFAVAPPTAQSTYTQEAQGQENVVASLDDSEIRRPPGHPDYVDPEAAKAPEAAPPPSEPDSGGGGYYGDEDGADYDETVATTSEGGGESSGSKGYSRKHYDTKKGGKRHKKPKKVATRDEVVIGGNTTPAAPRDTNASSGDAKVDALASQLKNSNQNIVIEGYADPNDPNGEQAAADRANLVRNQLIDQGVAPAQVRVENKGIVPGEQPGVKIVAETPSADQQAETSDAPPVGESHFVADHPMTVGKGSSVMASMLEKVTDGEIAYLYDPESARGNDKFAFRAVRIQNPTDSTLESGPVTVYGQDDDPNQKQVKGEEGGKMIGEGLTEPIPPHASVVIPFALDRQVVVEQTDSTDNQVSKLVTLQRGILTAEVQHIRKQHLLITNRLRNDTVVYVRHTVEKGWTLTKSPDTFEKIADAHLFAIPVQAGKTAEVDIEEATPMERTLDLNADLTLEMMNVYVQEGDASDELKAQLKSLLDIHKTMIDGKEKIDSLERRLSEYRVRMDELHGQILTLKSVKGGKELMKHLEEKMKDISDRVQKATIDEVDEEEQIMLAKVQFQDALSELHLDDALAVPNDTTVGLGTK